MTLVLLPDHEGKQRPVAFFSRKLPVDTGILNCLRAVAASDKTVMVSKDLIGYTPLTLLIPNAVSMMLYLYHAVLLEMLNITLKKFNVLNPSTLFPTEADGEQP